MNKDTAEKIGRHMVPGNPIGVDALAELSGVVYTSVNEFKREMMRAGLVTVEGRPAKLTLHKDPLPFEKRQQPRTRGKKLNIVGKGVAVNGSVVQGLDPSPGRLQRLVDQREYLLTKRGEIDGKLATVGQQIKEELGL